MWDDLFSFCIIRALFDRTPNLKEELNFKKGDILYVTDTMFNGHMGCWRACLVNEEDAQKRDIGMIPSRMKYVLTGLFLNAEWSIPYTKQLK